MANFTVGTRVKVPTTGDHRAWYYRSVDDAFELVPAEDAEAIVVAVDGHQMTLKHVLSGRESRGPLGRDDVLVLPATTAHLREHRDDLGLAAGQVWEGLPNSPRPGGRMTLTTRNANGWNYAEARGGASDYVGRSWWNKDTAGNYVYIKRVSETPREPVPWSIWRSTSGDLWVFDDKGRAAVIVNGHVAAFIDVYHLKEEIREGKATFQRLGQPVKSNESIDVSTLAPAPKQPAVGQVWLWDKTEYTLTERHLDNEGKPNGWSCTYQRVGGGLLTTWFGDKDFYDPSTHRGPAVYVREATPSVPEPRAGQVWRERADKFPTPDTIELLRPALYAKDGGEGWMVKVTGYGATLPSPQDNLREPAWFVKEEDGSYKWLEFVSETSTAPSVPPYDPKASPFYTGIGA